MGLFPCRLRPFRNLNSAEIPPNQALPEAKRPPLPGLSQYLGVLFSADAVLESTVLYPALSLIAPFSPRFEP